MDRLEQLQQDIAASLNGEDALAKVPVVAYRPLRTLADQVDAGAGADTAKPEIGQEQFWLLKKDGTLSGVGVRVNLPRLRLVSKNLSSPQFSVVVPILIAEQPLVNDSATGLNNATCGWLTAERVLMLVADSLQHMVYDGTNLLSLEEDAATVNVSDPKVRAWNLNVWATFRRNSTARATPPTIVIAAGSATVTPSASTDVYYTTDGSTPVKTAFNANSTLYTVPVAVGSGVTIRCKAYRTGYLSSSIVQKTG
jgi:hypothetical protein